VKSLLDQNQTKNRLPEQFNKAQLLGRKYKSIFDFFLLTTKQGQPISADPAI